MFGGLPKRYVVSIGVLLGIAAFVAVGFMVWYWLAPAVGVLGFLLAGVLPILGYAFIGAFMFDPTKTKDGFVDADSPSVQSRLMMSLLPIAIWAVFFAAIIGSWALPAVRITIVSNTVDSFPILAEKGLFDKDSQVAKASCQALSDSQGDRSADALLGRIMEADDELTSCIMSSLRNPTTNSRLYLEMRANQWFAELMNGAAIEDDACKRANWLRQTEAMGDKSAALQMYVCALDAKTPSARSCCADSIRAATQGNGIAAILPPPDVVSSSAWISELPSFTAYTAAEVDPGVAASITGERKAELRAWTTQLACASFEKLPREDRHTTATNLSQTFQKDTGCQLPTMSEKNFQIWNSTCSEVFFDAGMADSTVADSFCPQVHQAVVRDSVQEAQLRVRRAHRHSVEPSARRTLTEQLLDYAIANKQGPKRRSSANAIDGSSIDDMLDMAEKMGLDKGERSKMKDALQILKKSGVVKSEPSDSDDDSLPPEVTKQLNIFGPGKNQVVIPEDHPRRQKQ